jgi:hypothetical protein
MIQFCIYAIIAIPFIIWLIKASKDKSKWGINLKRVYCPVCHTKQPIIRMPGSALLSWLSGLRATSGTLAATG